MDKALWISWYDLPEDGRADYLSWLHGTYMPGILRRPGVLWGAHYASVSEEQASAAKAVTDSVVRRTDDSSLPTGNRYILLFGAEHTHVFANPAPSALHAGLPDESRKMLAKRIGERVGIMTEAARVEGPAAQSCKEGMMSAPCIQLGNFNCAYQHEEEMMAWYAQRRMVALSTMPGSVRTRKLVSVVGWGKHAILYEFESLAALNKYFPTREDLHPEQQEWSKKIVKGLVHAPGSANVATRIWPVVSN